MEMLQSKILFGQFFSTIYWTESSKHKPKDIQKKELNKETDVKKNLVNATNKSPQKHFLLCINRLMHPTDKRTEMDDHLSSP